MAATQDGKNFKQDMVVSIRYRNDLPPPPFPPKLLDIDHEGISQYLTPGFASSLARREDPNIEADAEGGMPIDMIGIPGYFLGDESAITAPEMQPVLDVEDTALLLTPDMLKKEGAQNKGFSFLRKTQYMTGSNALANTTANVKPSQRARKAVDAQSVIAAAKDDKENIKRNIQKGFDLAYPESIPFNTGRSEPVTQAERNAWRNPVHPDNQQLRPVEFYPILPDLEALNDGQGKWVYVKFSKPPLPAHRDRRDERIDVSLIQATENPKLMPAYSARKDAYDRDPKNYEDPGPKPEIYSLYAPRDPASVAKFRSMLNNGDPEKDHVNHWKELGDPESDGRVPFSRIRSYATATTDEDLRSERFMGISIYDPDKAPATSRLRPQGPAAYYHPIMKRLLLKSEKVGKGAARSDPNDDEDIMQDIADDILWKAREPTAVEVWARNAFKIENDSSFRTRGEQLQEAAISEAGIKSAEEEAKDIEDEQGALQGGEQDVSMSEVAYAESTEVAPSHNRIDRDDQSRQNGGVHLSSHINGEDQDESMDDD